MLELFPTNQLVTTHREVLTFASGLSENVGYFLSQHHFFQNTLILNLATCMKPILDMLRENKKFSQDLFQHVHRDTCHIEKLSLLNVNLNKAEIHSLSKAIQAGKLPQLKHLSLTDNKLTGNLQNLFGGSDNPGLPTLGQLDLGKTHLNREDLESLSEAVRAGKLPQLKLLYMPNIDLRNMEGEVESLIAACDTHCKAQPLLWLFGTGLSEESGHRWSKKYHNVQLINFDPVWLFGNAFTSTDKTP